MCGVIVILGKLELVLLQDSYYNIHRKKKQHVDIYRQKEAPTHADAH